MLVLAVCYSASSFCYRPCGAEGNKKAPRKALGCYVFGGRSGIRTLECLTTLPVFLTIYSFRYQTESVCGLDFAFTIAKCLRWEPSSLYTFPNYGLRSALPRFSPGGSPTLTPYNCHVSEAALDLTRPVHLTALPTFRGANYIRHSVSR